MLRQIWQWLKRFLMRLFGLNRSISHHYRPSTESLKPLSDTDYEFLLSQLLEGVKYGWDQKRILKFFTQLENRTTQQEWINWLQRFGAKVLASPASNQELGIRMVRLGQLTEFLPFLRRFGQESYQIGQQILNRSQKTQIWQYSQPETPPPPPQEEELEPITPGMSLTPDQLLARLYKDPALADTIAQQLGLEGSNPEQVVTALVNQMIELQNKTQSNNSHSENTWLEKGLEQVNQGDLAGAIASWDQAIAINPNFVQAWYNRGGALGSMGRLEEAKTSFERVVELAPSDYVAWNSLGSTLYKLELWEKAIAAWDQVIALKSDYYQAWYNRACALEHLGRLPESLDSYQKAIDIKPDFSLAQSRLNQLRNQISDSKL
ncbi:tetratricopeptide repeat protein [Gloeocapsa sp. PCC 73106]|uniref:tetratricopeptide repeat protein n=1 Tax=Gloeocapsa sp. PCC 73106 TaxID=102232 RepID=UPI0002AC6050|nr:tetratricopeptide repeat protein [Gloeocapsa sp. PCC 73106]ELR97054.1 tetratricopeptide repeat protein [Gloeocapsa sp. PCC 73106]